MKRKRDKKRKKGEYKERVFMNRKKRIERKSKIAIRKI